MNKHNRIGVGGAKRARLASPPVGSLAEFSEGDEELSDRGGSEDD